jgi:hypothetical protein
MGWDIDDAGCVFLYSSVYIDDDTLVLVSYLVRRARSIVVSLCICRMIASEMVAIEHQLCIESSLDRICTCKVGRIT